MADHDRSSQDMAAIEANEANVPSLTTIVARSFHPVNPVIKKMLPDTPNVRDWWTRIFADEIRDPSCHVLTALDPTSNEATGILTLRLIRSSDEAAGCWTSYSITEDHDQAIYEPMIEGMAENERTLMGETTHFLIELFGVDHAYKGHGVGLKLLSGACSIADEAGYPTFVQANASATTFYAKLGFQDKVQFSVPGGDDYVEHLMVRPLHAG